MVSVKFMAINVFWWKPFGNFNDAKVSLYRYHQAWAYLAFKNRAFSNFGDALNKDIMEFLSGESVVWSPLDKADYISVGSVIDIAERSNFNGQILGCGVRDESIKLTRLGTSNIKAVRGYLSASIVNGDRSIACGDPGLLAREIYKPFKCLTGSKKPLLIPHFNVLNSVSGRNKVKAIEAEGWDIAFTNISAKSMAERIYNASFVASSSLHGIIFADSLGVPSQLVDFGLSTNREPIFKYNDYYSIFGIEASFSSVDEIIRQPLGQLIDQKEEHLDKVSQSIESTIEKLYLLNNYID